MTSWHGNAFCIHDPLLGECKALMFSLITALTNCWASNWNAGYLKHHDAHVMHSYFFLQEMLDTIYMKAGVDGHAPDPLAPMADIYESFFCEVHLHGPLARYEKLRVAHAPGMPGTFSPPPRVSDPDIHHGTCVTHGSWCMPGSLTSAFSWSRWWGNRSRHSRRMRNPPFTYLVRGPYTENRELSWCHLYRHWWHRRWLCISNSFENGDFWLTCSYSRQQVGYF